MAKTPKTDSEEILDAVNETDTKNDAAASADSSSNTSAKKADPKPAKSETSSSDSDENPVIKFIREHPWICMFFFYLFLTLMVKFWGWATIVFLLIPIVCFGRIWLLCRDTSETIDQETHLKLEWWSKVGFMSALFGLTSALILNWIGVLHIFN